MICSVLAIAWLVQNPAIPGSKELKVANAEWLSEMGTAACEKYHLPALYLAVATKDGIQVGAAGMRVNNSDISIKARSDDLVCIASITKPFTSTLALALMERGQMSKSQKFQELFPETVGFIDAAYNDVTPWDLLLHRSGLPNSTGSEILSKHVPSGSERYAPAGSPLERFQYVLRILQYPPSSTKGKYAYSNPGFIALAAMEERAGQDSFESLISRLVFEPFGLRSARIGLPATPGEYNQPAYYPYRNGVAGKPFEGTPANDQSPLNSSTGRVVLSVEDLARFGWAFVAGASGNCIGLNKDSYKLATQPDKDIPTRTPVWEVVSRKTVGMALEHTGQSGDDRGFWSNSLLLISPSKGVVVAIVTNRGEAWEGMFSLRDKILEKVASKPSNSK